MSLDGFIAGPDADISGFVEGGKAVDQYLSDLKDFRTVIMGRKTYEFGYQYGLEAGKPAYPEMRHYIFSKTLQIPRLDPTVSIVEYEPRTVQQIRDESESDVYLCGGGMLAGALLEQDLIDILKLKVNPITLGSGTKLFGDSANTVKWKLEWSRTFEEGVQLQSYLRDR